MCDSPKHGSLLNPSWPGVVKCLWKHGPHVFATIEQGSRLMAVQSGAPEHTKKYNFFTWRQFSWYHTHRYILYFHCHSILHDQVSTSHRFALVFRENTLPFQCLHNQMPQYNLHSLCETTAVLINA